MSDDQHGQSEEQDVEGWPAVAGEGEDVCPRCGGSGEVDGATCPDCGGSGRTTTRIAGG